MSKATTVFNKYAAKKKRYMSEGVKGLLAGGPAAMVSTSVMFPMDTITTTRQIKATKDIEITFKYFKKNPKDILKLYKGLPPKLLKTVPGMALTFATYGIGKSMLDKRYTSKK